MSSHKSKRLEHDQKKKKKKKNDIPSSKQIQEDADETVAEIMDEPLTPVMDRCNEVDFEGQWTNMLIQEDADETVAEIMDELLTTVMDRCYEVDIERQIIPFTLFRIKSYLTQTVEQQMLFLDRGDEEGELAKTEDSEPMPATPDSWAQGCVPVVYAPHQPEQISLQEVNPGQIPVQTDASVKKKHNVVSLKRSTLKSSDKEDPRSPQIPKRNVGETLCNVLSPIKAQLKATRKKDQYVNSAPKKVQGQSMPSLFCSNDKKNMEVEGKNNKCSTNKHKTTHPHRNWESIPKLDPSSLPRHFILTEYEIVDNDILKDKPKKINGPLRPHPTLNKQGSECTVVSANPLTSSKDQPKQLQKRKDGNVCPSTHGKERHVSSGPLTPDTRVLEKAASLLDPTTAVIHPLTLDYRSRSKPVQSKPAVPLFSVDQVTAGPPPKVTPLFPPTNSDNYNA